MKLIIRQTGFFLSLTGLKPFRTPAIVDISKVNLNTLKLELKQQGVGKYEISEEPYLPISIEPDKKPAVSDSSNKLNEIHKMLSQLLSRQPTVEHHYHAAVQTLDRLVEEKSEPDIEEFIPDIDLEEFSDVELEYRTEKSEDAFGTAEALRKLKGDK